MILSAQTLRKLCPLQPFKERTVVNGMTYGLGPAGYDVRIYEHRHLNRIDYPFLLASTIEHFNMPEDLSARICDKSSWIRQGLRLGNTIIEPGWRGFLTLELFYDGPGDLVIMPGSPIAQIQFEQLDQPTELPYRGKYQQQEPGPQETRYEK